MLFDFYKSIGLPQPAMSEMQIVIFCIISAVLVIYTAKVNTRKNRNPLQRAVWAALFGLPLWVFVVFPVMKALGL